MKQDNEPWHQLIFVCPTCGREFRSEAVTLQIRLCPQCAEKEQMPAGAPWGVSQTHMKTAAPVSEC